MAKILILHGPNLNLLGEREPKHYGRVTLAEIDDLLANMARHGGHDTEHLQSNAEDALVERIHQASIDKVGFVLINPAAFTHTSVALLDALRTISKPKIEIHLSNIYNREDYRKKSITAEGVDGVICGLGFMSYILAIEAIYHLMNK